MATYNDGSVPFGSRSEDIKRGVGGTDVGTYIFENISIKRPRRVIERSDEIGQPNGYVIIPGFVTATSVLQIPTEDANPPQIGDWFEDTFDTDIGQERYVIAEVDRPLAQHDYHKCNITLRLSPNPPTT